MTILRQIKDLKSEFTNIHSHILRQVIEIRGCIPTDLDPKKPLRRTLLPGFLVTGGLPHAPSSFAASPHDHTHAPFNRTPEPFNRTQELDTGLEAERVTA
jgi:hypothetical protein